MRVLLVEDEALIALVAEEALSALGFETRVAFTAAEALDAVESFDPRLAVVDVGLPDMRGDELTRRLRAGARDLPVIIASGYDAVELRARFAGDARVRVTPKPYTQDDLARAAADLGVAAATTA